MHLESETLRLRDKNSILLNRKDFLLHTRRVEKQQKRKRKNKRGILFLFIFCYLLDFLLTAGRTRITGTNNVC